MGILDGKRILVAGVTMDSSIGFATAKVAQEQGATVLISNFGRALGITRRIAKRLPETPPVLELDVTDDEHLGADAHLDGVVHSIAYGNPETLLGGKFLTGPWPDVAQAVQVSAYSLKALTTAAQPLMTRGGSVATIRLVVTRPFPPGAPESLRLALGQDTRVTQLDEVSLLVVGPAGPTTLATVSAWCEEHGVLPESLSLGQRTLEDVFLELTGRELAP